MVAEVSLMKLLSYECHKTLLMMVQVMAWCRQATSHYLSQCWPRSMSPNGVTRPQWVTTPWPPTHLSTQMGSEMAWNDSCLTWSNWRSCNAGAPGQIRTSVGGSMFTGCLRMEENVFHLMTWSEWTTWAYRLAADGTTMQSSWRVQKV